MIKIKKPNLNVSIGKDALLKYGIPVLIIILAILNGFLWGYESFLSKKVENKEKYVKNLHMELRKARKEINKAKRESLKLESFKSESLSIPLEAVSRNELENLKKKFNERGINFNVVKSKDILIFTIKALSKEEVDIFIESLGFVKKGIVKVKFYKENKDGIQGVFKVIFKVKE